MTNPVLSICIPTRNRVEILDETLTKITSDDTFLNTDKIEIVISDNCSDDSTKDCCVKFKEKFPDKIKYIRQEHDILDKNFIEVLKCASGKYAKLNNDTLSYKKDALKNLIEYLEGCSKDVLFISNKKTKDNNVEAVDFKNFDEFLRYISYNCTWIGGLCVRTEKYLKLDSPDRFSNLNFAQVDIIARLSSENNISVLNGICMNLASLGRKGGYNICEVFGKNLITILNSLKKEGYISNKVYNKVLCETLLKHINYYHFDYNNSFDFKKTGYFKYLFEYYKFKPYFYINYIYHLLNKFVRLFVNIQKDEFHRKVTILGFIKIRFKRNKNRNLSYKKRNKHNKTWLVSDFQSERITVGKGTYGPIHALFSNNGNEELIIGNFCSIASGVKFVVSSEHPYKGLSTYPFKVHYFGQSVEAKSKGSIVIKDDVWIGLDAIILSGVTIGQGAIIGAGAVVTKDVPPYAIVGGNPAKIIKYRFSPEIVEKLLKFDFSKLTDEKIKKLGNRLYTEITEENADKLLEEFGSNV